MDCQACSYLNHERHDFEELFENNPLSELFNEKERFTEDYMNVTFEPGYDPEADPEDVSWMNKRGTLTRSLFCAIMGEETRVYPWF